MRRRTGQVDLQSPWYSWYRFTELTVTDQSDRLLESEARWNVPGKERAGEACQAVAGALAGGCAAHACVAWPR